MCDRSVGARRAVVVVVVEHMVAAILILARVRDIHRKGRVLHGRRRQQVNGNSARKVKAALRTRRRQQRVRSSRGMNRVPHRPQLARLSLHLPKAKATVAVAIDVVSTGLRINSRSEWWRSNPRHAAR